MRKNFIRWGNLSVRQIVLLKKLYDESLLPKVEENWIPIPDGVDGQRIHVEGTILSTKAVDSAYGETYKMLIKVETEDGNWKTWGTIPGDLHRWTADNVYYAKKGNKVGFTAKFTKSDRDECFSFFSRPTKAELLECTTKEDVN